MIAGLKQKFVRNLINAPGFRTKKKIVVIESDDWGSIRMPSLKVYNKLLAKGIISANDPFARFDSLASSDDLTALFETLSKFKDQNGISPVITANTIVGNPDFNKIKEADYAAYLYELFPVTLSNYPLHSNSFALWKQGMEAKLFHPQFHGREHLNVLLWMNKLENHEKDSIEAFSLETFAIDHTIAAAYAIHSKKQMNFAAESINSGFDHFSNLFGYQSFSFIAPNYTWNNKIEEAINEKGVSIIQGSKVQNKPILGKNRMKKVYHYTGQKNTLGQTYFVRNCLFEPSISPNADYVSACIGHISNAFFWNKPAIIGSHRLNYIGYLNEKNRSDNLIHLSNLLQLILKKWPDVEFMTTESLGRMVINE